MALLLLRWFDREKVDGGYHRHRMANGGTEADCGAIEPAFVHAGCEYETDP
jgi:hypothetical protein